MIFFINFHSNTILFNYCKDREKEGTLLLATYVHGLTDYYRSIKSTSCMPSHDNTRA